YADVVERAPADLEVDGLSPRERLDLRFAAGLDALPQGRWFVVDFPADQAALARLRPGRPDLAARFELVVDGIELANGYWELGDPLALEARFREDLAVRRQRGLREPAPDRRFRAAMAAGLPDCAGVALGLGPRVVGRRAGVGLREGR